MRSITPACASALVAAGTLFVAAAPAMAEPPDPAHSYARSDAGETWFCPRGDGNLPAWVVPTGIEVHLLNAQGAPLAGVPRADIWLTSSSPTFAICGGSLQAEADTDASGFTEFSHYSPPTGGCLQGQQTGSALALHVTAMGVPIPSEIRLDINSPDMNGDLRVNLGDVGPFSASLNGQYTYCADFFNDGAINLSDVGIFSAHLGHECI